MEADVEVPFLTSRQVADRYGVTIQEVHYALRSKKLRAQKAGWIWIFPAEDLPEEWPIERFNRKV